MNEHRRIKKIDLSGSYREWGLHHGKELKLLIYEAIDRTKYFLGKTLKKDPNRIFTEFAQENDLIKAVKKFTPELLEEVAGIADGADLDFDDVFAYQCAEEIWLVLPFEKEVPPGPKCSSLGCCRTQAFPSFIGQNLDWNSIYEGFNTLLHIHDDKLNLETYINTQAGLIANNGMNNAPLAICVNSLESDLNCNSKGLPVAFIIRALLEKTTVGEAVSFLTSINHASAENYVIGGIDKVVNYECSKNQKVEFIPEKNPGRVYHTNHPMVNTDLRVPPLHFSYIRNTFERSEYLKYRMAPNKPFTVDNAKMALSSPFGPINLINKGENMAGITFFSSIFQLTDEPEMLLTIGPPSQFPYQVYRLPKR